MSPETTAFTAASGLSLPDNRERARCTLPSSKLLFMIYFHPLKRE
jgi:hypothetical protein